MKKNKLIIPQFSKQKDENNNVNNKIDSPNEFNNSDNNFLRKSSNISDDYGIGNHALEHPKLRRIIDNCGNKQMVIDAKYNLENDKDFASFHE